MQHQNWKSFKCIFLFSSSICLKTTEHCVSHSIVGVWGVDHAESGQWTYLFIAIIRDRVTMANCAVYMLCLLIAFCAYIILVCQKYPHFMWFVCSLISRGSDWSPHNLSLFLFHAMKASLAEYSYYRQARNDVNQLEHNRVWRYCPRSEWLFSLDR